VRRCRPSPFPRNCPSPVRREDIARAIESHQVVIVSGETGSGKTTQLPKICLAIGRGERGLIGAHAAAPPRRLDYRAPHRAGARHAARRGRRLQGAVHRPHAARRVDQADDRRHPARRNAGRPALEAYDTLIIDEAHERSLNIDFLLGYLRQLLPRRPDLKVIITSATIDAERFAKHFGSSEGPAPIIEVSGRLYRSRSGTGR